jgi:pimeloyl-ACP methyl ester carboxylesterase
LTEPDTNSRPLGRRDPVAGGRDIDLPGDEIRLRGTRWYGDGVPIVLLHGLGSQRHFWDLVVAQLAGRAVVAIDQRGHGDSEQTDAGYDTDTIVRDVVTALDALGWRDVVVVGHSWGAGTALALAAEHPGRVRAVVAIDGGFARFDDDRPRAERRAMLEPPRIAMTPEDLRATFAEFARGFWSDAVADAVLPGFAVGDDGLARARLTFDRHMQIVDAMLDQSTADRLDLVHCPAWLVCAEPVAAAESPWLAGKLAGLQRAADVLAEPRLFRWAGADHDVPLQWPALVAGLIRAAAAEAEVRTAKGGTG